MINNKKYAVESMEYINNIVKNKYKVISTFSGAGGSSLGYKMAGFNVIWANEFIPAAQQVYATNHPSTKLNTKDIREVSHADILSEANLSVGELDIFDGSPPCASFSVAGNRDKDWGKVKSYSTTKQRVDDLFFEYIRLVKGVQPKVFIAENVPGLTFGAAKTYLQEILNQMSSVGYKVQYRILNAADYGVPQARKRLIFVGVRNDLSPIKYEFPTPSSSHYTTAEVLPWVTNATRPTNSEKWGERNFYNRPAYTVTCNDAHKLKVLDKGSTDLRKISIEELKILSSFPEDFILTGSYSNQFERIARAVPPFLMKAVAQSVKESVLDKL